MWRWPLIFKFTAPTSYLLYKSVAVCLLYKKARVAGQISEALQLIAALHPPCCSTQPISSVTFAALCSLVLQVRKITHFFKLVQ
jgi:hypothetical protein